MYLKSVSLKNIRCFKELSIDLTCDNGLRNWLVILGDNGIGKTTILRSIAMGLNDETSASALLRELSGDMIRFNEDKGVIEVELASRRPNERLVIKTEILRKSSGDSEIRQHSSPEDFPWNRLFVCGYGAGRRAFGSELYDKYRVIDSVYTLFNYDASLQNPELAFHRLSRSGVRTKTLLRRIERILMLPDQSIVLDSNGLSIKGPWGSFVPIGALGDGYAATLGWVSDLLGWAVHFKKKSSTPDFPGIVLLDEMEQHLHPSWQRRIIKLLRDQFPKLQFIGTTHAVMCAIGTTDLSDRECELVVLRQTGDHVEAKEDQKPPRGQRADQVLTSYLFGLTTSGDNAIRRDIERYLELKSKEPRTSKEETDLRQLEKSLKEKLGSEETELEREVSQAVRMVIMKKMTGLTFDAEAIDYEVKRQLRELFKFK